MARTRKKRVTPQRLPLAFHPLDEVSALIGRPIPWVRKRIRALPPDDPAILWRGGQPYILSTQVNHWWREVLVNDLDQAARRFADRSLLRYRSHLLTEPPKTP